MPALGDTPGLLTAALACGFALLGCGAGPTQPVEFGAASAGLQETAEVALDQQPPGEALWPVAPEALAYDSTQLTFAWLDWRSGFVEQFFAHVLPTSPPTLDSLGSRFDGGLMQALSCASGQCLAVFSTSQLLATRLDPSFAALDTTPIAVGSNQAFVAEAATDGQDYAVTWADTTGTYVRRLSHSGALLDAAPLPLSANISGTPAAGVGFDGTDYVLAWADFDAGLGMSGGRLPPSGTLQGSAWLPLPAAPFLGISVASGDGGSMVGFWSGPDDFVDVLTGSGWLSPSPEDLGPAVDTPRTSSDGSLFWAAWLENACNGFQVEVESFAASGGPVYATSVLSAGPTFGGTLGFQCTPAGQCFLAATSGLYPASLGVLMAFATDGGQVSDLSEGGFPSFPTGRHLEALPQVACGPGACVSTWTELSLGGAIVKANRLDPSGAVPFSLANYVGLGATGQSGIAAGAGEFAEGWFGPDGQVWVARLDGDAGVLDPNGIPCPVPPNALSYQYAATPSVAFDGVDFVAAFVATLSWPDAGASINPVFCVIPADGGAVTAQALPIQVSSGAGNVPTLALAYSGDGGLLVTSPDGLSLQGVLVSGTALEGTPTPLVPSASDYVQCIGGPDGFLLTGNSGGVGWALRLDEQGAPRDPAPIAVSSPFSAWNSAAEPGGYLVAFQDDSDPAQRSVKGVRLDSTGDAGPPILLTPDAGTHAFSPGLASVGGGYVLVFSRYEPAPSSLTVESHGLVLAAPPLGSVCVTDGDCGVGFCVAGVCQLAPPGPPPVPSRANLGCGCAAEEGPSVWLLWAALLGARRNKGLGVPLRGSRGPRVTR